MKYMPNILTVLRLLACPLLIYLYEINDLSLVLIIFFLACLTDFFDGYLAKKGNFKSNFGKTLDPIADKLLIITMCGLIIFHHSIWVIEIPVYIIIIREMIVSFLRFNLADKNKNIDVSLLSKYKTFFQMIAIGSFILSLIVIYKFPGFILAPLSLILMWLSAFITIITGVQHFKTYLKLKK